MAKAKYDELILEEERVVNAHGTDSDLLQKHKIKFDIMEMCNQMQFEVMHQSHDVSEMNFDLKNVEPQFANCIRRLILAEVATMAIEKVYLYQNTSLIQDEVLCHRMGLIPIKVDPRLFLDPLPVQETTRDDDIEQIPDPDPQRNIVFKLHVKCVKNGNVREGSCRPEDLYVHSNVYSGDLEWVPCGEQTDKFKDTPPSPVLNDILIAKLRPGQEIEMVCHCSRGIGRDHAKFSPVATASYRLLPTITITKPIIGEDADLFKSCFSNGVVQVRENKNGEREACIEDARMDMCSRNVLRHKHLAHSVVLGRQKNHFIFNMESTGALEPVSIVLEACQAMQHKCDSLLQLIAQF